MTPREIIDRAIGDFESILDDLGFDRPQRTTIKNRRACVLCGASNQTTFSYRPDAGIWKCFRCDRRGGLLDLVEASLGYDRPDALRWLAQHLGVELDGRRPPTPEEKRRYAQRRARAETAARDLTEWRSDLLERLRSRRNALYNADRRSCKLALRMLSGVAQETEGRWAVVWAHALDDQRATALDVQIASIEKASPAEIAAMRRAA